MVCAQPLRLQRLLSAPWPQGPGPWRNEPAQSPARRGDTVPHPRFRGTLLASVWADFHRLGRFPVESNSVSRRTVRFSRLRPCLRGGRPTTCYGEHATPRPFGGREPPGRLPSSARTSLPTSVADGFPRAVDRFPPSDILLTNPESGVSPSAEFKIGAAALPSAR